MKRSRAEGAQRPSTKAVGVGPGKAQRRPKAASPRSSAGRARLVAAQESNAGPLGGGDEKGPEVAGAAGLLDSPSFASVLAEHVQGAEWGDGAAELGEWRPWWWWCLSAVEEEKLSGWFPFVDEDFLYADARGGEGAEEADHDIWQLQSINEIPQTASK